MQQSQGEGTQKARQRHLYLMQKLLFHFTFTDHSWSSFSGPRPAQDLEPQSEKDKHDHMEQRLRQKGQTWNLIQVKCLQIQHGEGRGGKLALPKKNLVFDITQSCMW